MDRDLYKRWHNHPIRALVRHAAAGGHVYDDQITDLRLPAKIEGALRDAISHVQAVRKREGQVPQLGHGSPDHLSSEIVAALPDHHETRLQHEERRAAEGDATALANIKAREEGTARLADQIMRGGL